MREIDSVMGALPMNVSVEARSPDPDPVQPSDPTTLSVYAVMGDYDPGPQLPARQDETIERGGPR